MTHGRPGTQGGPVAEAAAEGGGHPAPRRHSHDLASLTQPAFGREGRMASRDGPMVSGTDGSDFVHRETVAPHYQIR